MLDGALRRRALRRAWAARRRTSRAGSATSAPTSPSSVVRVMQQDALERLNLTQMLLEPEMLEPVEADVHLVATLLSLSHVIPEQDEGDGAAGRAQGGGGAGAQAGAARCSRRCAAA